MDLFHSVESDPPPLSFIHQSQHDELELLTQQFLARGGVIFDGTACGKPHKPAAFNGGRKNKDNKR